VVAATTPAPADTSTYTVNKKSQRDLGIRKTILIVNCLFWSLECIKVFIKKRVLNIKSPARNVGLRNLLLCQ
jgi:hypothetical protein